jgi:hypothetical protein
MTQMKGKQKGGGRKCKKKGTSFIVHMNNACTLNLL